MLDIVQEIRQNGRRIQGGQCRLLGVGQDPAISQPLHLIGLVVTKLDCGVLLREGIRSEAAGHRGLDRVVVHQACPNAQEVPDASAEGLLGLLLNTVEQ